MHQNRRSDFNWPVRYTPRRVTIFFATLQCRGREVFAALEESSNLLRQKDLAYPIITSNNAVFQDVEVREPSFPRQSSAVTHSCRGGPSFRLPVTHFGRDAVALTRLQVEEPGNYKLCLVQFYKPPEAGPQDNVLVLGSDDIGTLRVKSQPSPEDLEALRRDSKASARTAERSALSSRVAKPSEEDFARADAHKQVRDKRAASAQSARAASQQVDEASQKTENHVEERPFLHAAKEGSHTGQSEEKHAANEEGQRKGHGSTTAEKLDDKTEQASHVESSKEEGKGGRVEEKSKFPASFCATSPLHLRGSPKGRLLRNLKHCRLWNDARCVLQRHRRRSNRSQRNATSFSELTSSQD